MPGAQGIYNSAVVPYGDGFAGVFRVELRSRYPHLHTGWSEDGLVWHIEPQPIPFDGDPEVVASINDYAYDPLGCPHVPFSQPTGAWGADYLSPATLCAFTNFWTSQRLQQQYAAAWSAVWVALGVGFGALLWWWQGPDIGQQYFAGYLIEKSLAVDNVFVWAVIFSYFTVPPQFQHRVLFLGVLGALVLRGAFIAVGAVLIENFSWILYVFAAFLLYTGWRMIRTLTFQHEATLSVEGSDGLCVEIRFPSIG